MKVIFYSLVLLWCGFIVSSAGLNVVLVALCLGFLLNSLNIIDRLRDLFTRVSDSEVRECASKHNLPLDFITSVDCDRCPSCKFLYCKKIFESELSDQEDSNV